MDCDNCSQVDVCFKKLLPQGRLAASTKPDRAGLWDHAGSRGATRLNLSSRSHESISSQAIRWLMVVFKRQMRQLRIDGSQSIGSCLQAVAPLSSPGSKRIDQVMHGRAQKGM